MNTSTKRLAVIAALAASLGAGAVATAQDNYPPATATATAPAAGSTARQVQVAHQRVQDAMAVVRAMQSEPRMKALLEQARGVLLVPSYGKAALGVGAQGGAGLLLLRQANGQWSSPAFYNLGGLTLGLQAGAEGGPVAFVLVNDKAADEFMKRNNLSLSAQAGLTVVNWSKIAVGSVGNGDVVAWSGAKGLFGDLVTVGVNDVRYNQALTNAYYGRTLTPKDVVSGTVSNTQAQPLQQALATASSTAH